MLHPVIICVLWFVHADTERQSGICHQQALSALPVPLQVHVQVQAFLTLPDLTADGGGLDDRCQVIQPFSIETAVDHCVEPTSKGNYRCSYFCIRLFVCTCYVSH